MAENNASIAARVRELMSQGMDVEAAIAKAQAEAKQQSAPSVPNIARSIAARLGLQPSDPAHVTVKAKAPDRTQQLAVTDPEMMERIALGTKTTPPLGMHTPLPGEEGWNHVPPSGKSLPPNIRAVWQEAVERWPFAAKSVNGVEVASKSLGGDALAQYNSGRGVIEIDPETSKKFDREMLLQILAHELTHAEQNNAFPDAFSNVMQWNNPFDNYWDRQGEGQAYDAQLAVTRKLLDERKKK